MKKLTRRVLPLVLALTLGLGLLSALAEAPAVGVKLAEYLKYDGNTQVEAEIKLHPQLAGIIGMVAGEPMDEVTATQFTTVINAVNKLKLRFVSGKGGASGTLGTDKGSLIDFQVAYNAENFDNHLTTNLLPGIALSADPAMLEGVLGSVSKAQFSPEQMQQLAQPYLSAATEYFNSLLPSLPKEEGTFTIEGYGTFTKRTQAALTTHAIAGLMQKIADVYKQDENLKQFISQLQNDLPESEGAEVLQDLGQELENMAKQGLAEPDQTLLTGWVYESDGSEIYIDAATPGGTPQGVKLDLLYSGAEQQHQTKGRIIIKAQTAFTGETTTPPAPIDWVALEGEITGGQNYTDTLVTFDVQGGAEGPAMSNHFSLNLHTSGLKAGLSIEGSNNLETRVGSSVLSLFMGFPEPLVTVSIHTAPTEEAPVAPLTDGAAVVTLKEGEQPEETNALLEASLQKAIPALLSNLNTVLPEEGPALLQLLQGGAQPSISEPEVESTESEGAEAEEESEEAMPEPSPVNP